MKSSIVLTTTACGVFFLTALLTGVWKWRAMVHATDHQAPFYVDTAHRAALMYSFACLVLIRFLELSPLPDAINLVAAGLPLFFFALAIGTYVHLGYRNTTTNQFAMRSVATTTGTGLLAVCEIGGFAMLFGAFVVAYLL